MRWVLSARAQIELRDILSESGDQFGQSAQRRYRLLFEQAIEDVADDPRRTGVRGAGDQQSVWLYHLRHARGRVPANQRVTRARHLLVFQVAGDEVTILRILHDAMDLPRRLQDV
jgi:toxin ParE1/3/4